MRGKLIVFEGTDGSGKATQSRLLCEHLDREGIPYQKIDFPRYGKPSAAMVQEYLDGNLGKKPGDVNAYAASMFYAMDRYASYKQDWGAFYEAGGLIVADRYTTSNAVHQASKLPKSERDAYLNWLFETEYGLLGLPKPDLVLYLEPDIAFVQDGTRNEIIHQDREKYSAQIKQLLQEHNISYHEISGDYLQRFEKAKQLIEQHLGITTRF